MSGLPTPDFDWVSEGIAVGARFEPDAVPLLVEAGVNGVVDLREEDQDDRHLLARHGIDFLHLPTPDAQPATREMLRRGVAFVKGHVSAGRKVLVHCHHGIGRSALLAGCVLVSEGVDPASALQRLRLRRPRVTLSESQCRALLDWADWLSPLQQGCGVSLERLLEISWGPTPPFRLIR